ncbi:hypothetical protein CANCADRAFT_134405 [Tortispora caseinolytica NRRL Y-17796]|uniref:PDZ GRASP-type domain-containing protein n=1 Tax=Tortispora caseinolytica NRRL Y-17796 TaxID=767744 RepID=A0A1E4TBN2_9ASCO|nr:hypothetical protein CANCADRAFT_134405 [Tortispora caseinolytica NRRL Y-17796]
MGAEISSLTEDQPDFGGLRVLSIKKDSLAHKLGLKVAFDYIVGINAHTLEDDPSMLSSFKLELDSCLEHRAFSLQVYNSLSNDIRTVYVPPPEQESSRSLGCSLQYAKKSATSTVWRILNMQQRSPAWEAGLLPEEDFVIAAGVLAAISSEQTMAAAISNSKDKELTLIVYNSATNTLRPVKIVPRNWSGTGLLGCSLVPYPADHIKALTGQPVASMFEVDEPQTVSPSFPAQHHPSIPVPESPESLVQSEHQPPNPSNIDYSQMPHSSTLAENEQTAMPASVSTLDPSLEAPSTSQIPQSTPYDPHTSEGLQSVSIQPNSSPPVFSPAITSTELPSSTVNQQTVGPVGPVSPNPLHSSKNPTQPLSLQNLTSKLSPITAPQQLQASNSQPISPQLLSQPFQTFQVLEPPTNTSELKPTTSVSIPVPVPATATATMGADAPPMPMSPPAVPLPQPGKSLNSPAYGHRRKTKLPSTTAVDIDAMFSEAAQDS